MSRMRQAIFCLAAAGVVFTAAAQTNAPVPAKRFPNATNLIPPVPVLPSPVNFFRQLLVMTPAERNNSLTNRTPEARAKILAKVREYQVLGPDERELRLRATELRWFLAPLLPLPPAQRTARFALMPADLHALIQARLAQWDALPPAVQQEFLANDKALRALAHVEPTTTNTPTASAEQQKIADQFNQFFELTPEEKQQTLNTLSKAERAAMEKTLQSFNRLTSAQRELCLRNYAKFAGMSAEERADFLKNAEMWAQMSPKERQVWRDLVARIPAYPPLPVKIPRPTVATNLN